MAGAVAPRRPPARAQVAAISLVVVVASGAAAAAIVHRDRSLGAVAGLVAFLGLVALVAPARSAAPDPERGSLPPREAAALAARILAPVFEGSILLATAWTVRGSAERTSALALVSFGLSYLAIYERAKAQGLRYAGRESALFLAVRDGLLVVGVATGWMEASLWAFAAFAGASAAVRAYNVVHQERFERTRARSVMVSSEGS
jgi:hypothetical protein